MSTTVMPTTLCSLHGCQNEQTHVCSVKYFSRQVWQGMCQEHVDLCRDDLQRVINIEHLDQ